MASTYIAPEYKPTAEVRATHSVLHIDPFSMKIVDNTFDPLTAENAPNRAYLYSIVTIPAFILGVGLLAIALLFIISNCCAPKTCFWTNCWYYIFCCSCCPAKEREMTDIDIGKGIGKRREIKKTINTNYFDI